MCPPGEAVHDTPSAHHHLVIDDDPIFEVRCFGIASDIIRLVFVISSLFCIFENLRSILDISPGIFTRNLHVAQVKQLQELLELKQVKLNRCTAELQALGFTVLPLCFRRSGHAVTVGLTAGRHCRSFSPRPSLQALLWP